MGRHVHRSGAGEFLPRTFATAIAAAMACAWAGGCGSPGQPPARARAELWIAGDVHLGATAAGALDAITPRVAGAVGIINLEGAVGPGAERSSATRLVNDLSAVTSLRRAGVVVAGIANNHARDLGEAAPNETARALAGIGLVPAGDVAGPALISAGGVRVAVTAHDLSRGVPTGLAETLAQALRRSDALVAIFHVTGPPSYIPKPELRAAVDVALAAGARVVAAHGTHALGPIERRGDAVVAWGLGNLAFACDCGRSDEGLILRVAVPAGGPVEAAVIQLDAGISGRPARLAVDLPLAFDLLEAIRSSPLSRRSDRADL